MNTKPHTYWRLHRTMTRAFMAASSGLLLLSAATCLQAQPTNYTLEPAWAIAPMEP
ncbi:MAG TPA: hypothetical protein VN673_11450 [Clostridia bacterium]|nr:hypothetical protein [Clostridia bacterium]